MMLRRRASGDYCAGPFNTTMTGPPFALIPNRFVASLTLRYRTSNSTVGFTVAANSGPQRTGTITVARQTFTVNQDGSTAPAPTILIEQGTGNRAVALDSVTFVRGPFRVLNDHNFSSDHHTRVIIFTSNLGMTQPNPAVLTVQASGFDLPVESVAPFTAISGFNGSYIVVRLPDGLPSGDLSLTVTLNGNMSNITTISISP